MKNVDRVLILEFQDKSSSTGDVEISNGTKYLAEKARLAGTPVETCSYIFDSNFVATSHYMSHMNPLMGRAQLAGIGDAMGRLTDNSELILRGHGSAMFETLSKINAVAMAQFLRDVGFGVNCKINITSCQLGRGSDQLTQRAGTTSAARLSEASFARTLIEQLCRHGLRNEVHARLQNVKVNADGSKTTRAHGATTAAAHVHQQADSKIIFTCDQDGYASCRYAY
nr:C80 family cysteine peptidase [uncultured Massilia sp.]